MIDIFKAFSKLDIQENTSDLECAFLIALAKSIKGEKPLFVEIGTWKGKTAATLGLVAQIMGGILYNVDHFLGNKGTGRDTVAKRVDLFNIFRTNMKYFNLWQTTVFSLVMDSVTASRLFNNSSIDLLFIDAGHTYNEVYQDIELWLPKVKKGGIICGHDCQEYYIDFKKEVDSKYETIDCGYSEKFNKEVHFAVIKAVYDHFGDKYKILKPTSIWIKKI
jgi:hypothetical protein